MEVSLKKVVVVSRHGIRRQFPSSTFSFSEWAPGKLFDTEDEAWGVDGSMGVLTEHGYANAKLMGEQQGERLRGIFDTSERRKCGDIAFVYCEEDMPRDEFTARGFFEGFFSALGRQPCEQPLSLFSKGVE